MVSGVEHPDGHVHDVVVVGGGPGGYATAFRASARGLDVALVERDRVGGTCLHRGCIPSKASLHVAGVADELARAETLGLKVSFDGLEGAGLQRFRQGVIDSLHHGLQGLVDKRTTFHAGTGRVARTTDGLEVAVTTADGTVTRVRGRHVVLATGSVPRHLPGVEVDGDLVQTSDQALWFEQAPRRAVIVGAGAIGLEFASMWRPLGTEITVVEAADRILPAEDVDASRQLARALGRRGIELVTGATVTGLDRDGTDATVTIEVDGRPRELVADRVLVAIGRTPATDGTGAAELGILDDHGYIDTDAHGATPIDGLWAVGDLRPTLALAHAAFAEGFVVADRIAGLEVPPVDHTHTPRVTYSHPEVASVGLTETQARDRYGHDAVAVATTSFKGNAKGLITGTDGIAKVIHLTTGDGHATPGIGLDPTRQATGPVLGVHLVGPHATDLIAEATLATHWEALPAELAAITHAHPTLYETLGETFHLAAGLPFHAP